MIVFDLCLRASQKSGHQLGHRVLAAGETLIRGQVKSAEDLRFFANHLRWSAFEVIAVSDKVAPNDPLPVTVEPKAKRAPRQRQPDPQVTA